MNKFIVKPNLSVKEINLIREEAERGAALRIYYDFGAYATQSGIPASNIRNQWEKWSEDGVTPSRKMMADWVICGGM